jgi:NTE family protein
MASACLPYLIQAVAIDRRHYWDGGDVGNPALFPLFRDLCAGVAFCGAGGLERRGMT